MNIPISYNWIKSHFNKDIPSPEKISDLFMRHLCEVEGVEKKEDDTIFDLKIMPDRGHDLLSHCGIAHEVSVLSGVAMKEEMQKEFPLAPVRELRVSVENSNLCPRYMGRVIEGVMVGPSPKWLSERLESVGQRSINNIVDITNYVMLELGQPMHAFDLDKLSSDKNNSVDIFVRKATNGEKIKTLDEKDIILTPDTLVIADSKQVLAIAGVKGGKEAGVDETTTSIVFESANFNAVNTRKTSARVGIRTDSSKRYEHEISSSLAEEAMNLATELLFTICPDARIGEVVDIYPNPEKQEEVGISLLELNAILGTKLSSEEVAGILNNIGYLYKESNDKFTVTVPLIRLDLRIKEDLAEEIGRVYGFDKVPSTPIPEVAFTPKPLKAYYYANMIRDSLVAIGYSEVYTYSFQNEGAFAVANPIAEDKGFLRKDFATGIGQALVLNTRTAPLLGLDEIKIFEIGKIFPGVMEEKLSCAIGVELTKAGKKKNTLTTDAIQNIVGVLSEVLGVKIEGTMTGNIFEFDLGALLEKLPEPKVGKPFTAVSLQYKRPSAYPFVLRDIAVWGKEATAKDEILAILRTEGGELLVRDNLFDVFTKELEGVQKTSYAFNLVFQSYERTLSDIEINEIMRHITANLTAQGFEVR